MTQGQSTTSVRSPQLESWFREYEADHTHPQTKLTHMVGIPMIVVALVKILMTVPLLFTNLALVAIVGIVVFFVKHDRKLALTFGGVLCGIYLVTFLMIPSKIAWFLFVVGWGLQFYGHYKFEKRSPAFFKNLLHLLVGPLWITARLTGQR